MKKWMLVSAFTVMFVPSVLAQGFVDTMTCKQVQLKGANNRTVLVKRLTGEVKYAKQHDGTWKEVTGEQKKRYQSLYNAQVHPRQ